METEALPLSEKRKPKGQGVIGIAPSTVALSGVAASTVSSGKKNQISGLNLQFNSCTEYAVIKFVTKVKMSQNTL